jgi:lycopene cyclase domain-containing protein
LSDSVTRYFTITLIFIGVIILLFNYNKWYTLINFLVFILLLCYAIVTKNKQLNKFYISFLVILIPFFIVNGLLTGSGIEQEIVWYNNEENLNFRLFTIPIEDVFYAFSMLFSNLILIEKFKKIFN